MNLKVTRLGYAMRRFVEGFRHGVSSQHEIGASKQRPPGSPSTAVDRDRTHGFEHWSTVHTLLERLDSEADRLAIYGDRLREYIAQGTIDKANWQAIEHRLSREHNRQEFSETKREIQAAVREKLLTTFIQEHVSTKFDYQKELLKDRIETLLWEGRKESLRTYLKDVLELGLEKADKKLKREQRKGGYAGYVWAALVGILKVGIVLGAFSVARTKFETVVIALIILTYQMVQGSSKALGISILGGMSAFRETSSRVRRLLKEEMPEEMKEREMEEDRELEKFSHRTIVLTFIRDAFDLIIFAIALFELVFEGIF